MSEEGYDLRKSLHSVKHLYPIIKDSHGNVIDGFHRLEADGDWPTKTLDHIKTPTQLELARLVANTHRREVTREERAEMITNLAKALVDGEGVPKEDIVNVLRDLTTFSGQYIRNLLPPEYKRKYTLENLPQRGDSTVPFEEEKAETTSFPIETYVPVEEVLRGRDRYTAEEEFVVYLLQERSGLSENEAKRVYEDWMGKSPLRQTSLGEKASPAVRSGSPGSYRPSAPPTTRCPLCGRDGADKLLILMYAEKPESSQMTLEKFIAETIAR